jgi:hypothetical protein
LALASRDDAKFVWSKKPDTPTCPFDATCGAYARIRPQPALGEKATERI